MRIARGISVTNTSKPISTAIVYDADALAFFTSASITDTTQKNAVNQLVLDLKSASIWTKMKALYPIVGGVSSSHAVNLKQPGTYNLTFATGWTHSSTGMTPNGATYANTSFIPSLNLTLFNSHQSYYSRTNNMVSGTKVFIGALSNGGSYDPLASYYLFSNATNIGCTQNSEQVATDLVSSSQLSRAAFWMNNRTSSTATTLKLWKNGIAISNATTSTSGQKLNTRPLFIGALNNSTAVGNGQTNFTDAQCAFASIGDGLTDAEALLFYTAVQNYQTTLGRQV